MQVVEVCIDFMVELTLIYVCQVVDSYANFSQQVLKKHYLRASVKTIDAAVLIAELQDYSTMHPEEKVSISLILITKVVTINQQLQPVEVFVEVIYDHKVQIISF